MPRFSAKDIRMIAPVGRNEKCPCGSGKKYKKCCLHNEQAALKQLPQTLLHNAANKAAELLLDYSERIPGPQPTSPPLEVDVPELPDTVAQEMLFHKVIVPWLLYLHFPREHNTSQTLRIPSLDTIASQYLTTSDQRLDNYTRQYIQAAIQEPFSFWEIQDIDKGVGLSLKDLVTGRERFVHDVAASTSAIKWDIMFAQVIGLNGVYALDAVGPYSLQPAR